MKKSVNRNLFRFIRFWARCFTHRYRMCRLNDVPEPAVYVVHHQNLRGPLLSMIWFDRPVRPWVLSAFCSRKACFNHYLGYTFTKRFGLPKALAAIIVYPLSYLVPGLMKAIEAIPVFRGSRHIIKTFRQSICALSGGQSVLICPDIDYKDTSSIMGEMYEGFLHLEKYYLKETGKHLPFVPVHISKQDGCIYMGQAIFFNEGLDFNREKKNVYERLKQEFSNLQRKYNS